MKSELKLSQKALILVAIPVLFQIVFVALLGWVLARAEFEGARQAHNRTLLTEANALVKLCHDSGMLLYAYASTRNSAVADSYYRMSKQIPAQVDLLSGLAGPNKTEARAVHEMEEVAVTANNVMDKIAVQIKLGAGLSELNVLDLRSEMLASFDKLLHALREISQSPGRASDPVAEVRLHEKIQAVLFSGLLANVVVAFWLAAYFNVGTTKRLAVLMDNAEKLPQNQPLNEPIGGTDEIGDLDRVFHEMAEALKAAERERRQLEQLKQEFVSMISHDLRTPLMSVQTALAMLSSGVRGELPGKALRDVTSAERNMAYVISLINNLLEIEQISTGLIRLARHDCDALDLIQKAQDAVAPLIENKSMQLVVQPCETPMHVDDQRLVQVLVNLLSNAIKFSPRNGTITLSAIDRGDDVTFSVKDEGRGIPLEAQEKVFERFYQVSATDATEKRGTGLGLSICKAIVETHGGTIGVNSIEGQGSTFWLRVPKEPPEMAEAEATAADKGAAESAATEV